MSVELKIGIENLSPKLRKYQQEVRKIIQDSPKEMKAEALKTATRVTRKHFKDRKQPWKRSRSKSLERNWVVKFRSLGDGKAQLILDNTNVEADFRNRGGTITAKRSALTIPLTPEAFKAGGASKFGRKLFRPRGKRVLVEERNGVLTAHYALAKSVEQEGSYYIEPVKEAVLKKMKNFLLRKLRERTKKGLK